MLDVDRIRDFDQLKQVTRLLQQENDKLHERLVVLTRELAKLRGEQAQGRLALEIQKLQRQMDAFQRQLEGASGQAEKRKKPQRGHGPRPQPKLAIEDRHHELPQDERICPACQGELREMAGQFEESEEVTVVQRQFKLLRHRRQKYRCRCNGAVVTAPAPKRLIEGGRYSVEFAVEVAAGKYLDHLPLDRQRRMMGREGLRIDTQTLWDQLFALHEHLRPSYDALLARILQSPQVGADETWWRLMEKNSSKKWWDWCLTTREVVYHRIHPRRSAEVVEQLLADYQGTVMSDGFKAYETLQRAGPGLPCHQAHCWAHARRRFADLEPLYPEAHEVLDLIRQLYLLERTVPDSEDALPLRKRLRQTESREVVDKIRDWAVAQRASPQSGLREAINYMLGLWKGLTRFLDDPRVPLDNNATERSLKGVVLGRKNHYGSRSKRGTLVAALFYSLIETAKLCGIDPKAYLLQAAKAAIERPGTVLLPHELLSTEEAPAA